MKIFVCKNRFEDMMSCIYDAWSEALICGHNNVSLRCMPVLQEDIFDEYIYVESDREKYVKVVRSVIAKMGEGAFSFIKYATLSDDAGALDAIYRFMILGFKLGYGVTNAMTEPEVIRLMEIKRRVTGEAHLFKEFVRFTSFGEKIYISHIEPKNNVLELVGEHFAKRMPSENFMIVDDKRKLAIIHPKDEENYFRCLTEKEYNNLKRTDSVRDEYSRMWKTFFDTIAIKERTNKKCQQNLLPLWMRKHMVEFME